MPRFIIILFIIFHPLTSWAIDQPDKIIAFPVVIENDTIFKVYEPVNAPSISSYSDLCESRLRQVLARDFFHHDSLKVIDSLSYTIIKYENISLVKFSPITTQTLDITPEALSQQYIQRISDFLHKKQPHILRSKILRALYYGALFILLFLLFRFLYRTLNKIINNNPQIILRFYSLLRIYQPKEEEKEKAVQSLLSIVRWIYGLCLLILLYFMLPAFLKIFYYTRDTGDKILSYFTLPLFNFLHKTLAYIPTLINIIIILLIFRVFIRIVNFIFDAIKQGNIQIRGFYKEWSTPTSNLVKFILYAFLITILFPLLPGSDSDVFKGVSVFIGLLLSLGSTSVIANVLSGIIMTYMRPFKIGDRIEADSVIGIVVQKNLLITRIRTSKNVIVTIPNSKILSSHSQNFTTAAERSNLIIYSTITIGYDVDWRVVHKLLISAAHQTNGIIEQSGKESFVLQKSLDDFYVSYEINAYISQADKYLIIQSDLHQNILDEFKEAEIEIMSPHYRANRDGEESTVPVIKIHDEHILNEEDKPNINDIINKKIQEKGDHKKE